MRPPDALPPANARELFRGKGWVLVACSIEQRADRQVDMDAASFVVRAPKSARRSRSTGNFLASPRTRA